MSITQEYAVAHSNDPAVLTSRAEVNTLITAAYLEDPATFPDLIDSGLLDTTSALTIGQVLDYSRMSVACEALTPLTAEKVDRYYESSAGDNYSEAVTRDDLERILNRVVLQGTSGKINIVEGYYYNGQFYANSPTYSLNDQPAVLKVRQEAGTLITSSMLEDPDIFEDLIDSGLLVVSGALSIGQVAGTSTLNNVYDSLTPITAEMVDTYNTTYTYDYSNYPTILRTPDFDREAIIGETGKIYVDLYTNRLYRYDNDVTPHFIEVSPGTNNLVNGSAVGSVRGIGAAEESSSYTMGHYAFAEGYDTIASKLASHAEGRYTTASGDHSHAEGFYSMASSTTSHAEGYDSTASGLASHAEGSNSTASSFASHAQNFYTVAGYDSQTAIGKYNDNQSGSAFEIGNGTSTTARSNAFRVDWTGNVFVGLDTSAATGTDDGDLYTAITTLGWSDVIE